MERVKFLDVCKIFDTIEGISSRNETTMVLSEFYKTLGIEDAQILSYLILGRVAPSFVNSEFNYSEKSFLNLLESFVKMNSLTIDVSLVRRETGDIGDTVYKVVEGAKSKETNLSLLEVYGLLWKIVNTTGPGSVSSKNILISSVMTTMSPLELKYFTRIVCGSLRFGINYRTLLDVFSYVAVGDKGLSDELSRAYGVHADIGEICATVVGRSSEESKKMLEEICITPGIPVLSRLVERVGSFEETIERLGEKVLVQPKFDGLRCQIHKYKESGSVGDNGAVWKKYLQKNMNTGGLFGRAEDIVTVKLFTRNLEDVTAMFPEIVQSAREMSAGSFVLDSEVLGWDGKKFLPFQDTMQRRRKHGVENMGKDIPVKAMCFDILALEDRDFLKEDTVKRVKVLEGLDTQGSIDACDTKVAQGAEALKGEFDLNVSAGYEGIIVKKLEGGYCPGERNYDWIKMKKSMLTSLVDTVDLVAVGYYVGSGRRSSLGVGAVLGALYNPEMDRFEAICKVGTGFDDEILTRIGEELGQDRINDMARNVICPNSLTPDIWVVPKIVFTVEADEITRSLARVDENIGGGFSLRFPRLVEWGRDKGVAEATTIAELETIFEARH